jgi:NAD(P)-dependent dehydrogenase (short-subunit alcohol dehydrogenase family)
VSAAVPLEPASALLTDRVAVVTGAAVGIGRAVALSLARFGAHVAACDRDADNLATLAAEVESAGRRCVTGVLDVREPDQVAPFLDAVAQALQRVDVLVNNAGGGFHANFVDVSLKGQSSLVRENFDSVTHFIRGVVPLMPAAGGSIVNITSIEAHRAAPGFAIYSAQKAAIANLSKTLALELGAQRIRVNCVAPDVIPTPGVPDLPEQPTTPLPVHGDAEDVAAAVVFLAGDLARFVTGTTVHVDGGNAAAGGWRRADDGTFHT